MATTDSFATSSGKEITVNISDAGEPESVEWNIGPNTITLSENEVLEIAEYLNDYDSDDNDDDD